MRDKLRKRYQVQKEVTQNGRFEGNIALSGLKRLGELVHFEEPGSTDRNVAVSFEFVRNEFDIPTLVGHLQTSLDLECQRCLKPIRTPMELDFRLMIDASDEIVRQSSLDTLYSDDGYIDITEVIEDELILAVPLVAMHEDAACNEDWPIKDSQPEATVKENPFSVLQQLKTKD
ncbi:MAG: hypothetical protein GY815_10115 [Gammaproteobacteria bacterium]|nr:hypothetical protein [Gammaproteobacteria bacterium]